MENGNAYIIYVWQNPKMEVWFMEYIAEKIGDNYQEWKNGDVVFIFSPTGSGKTTFILKKLLPYLAEKGQRILYLVNRTALKLQLEIECKDIFGDYAKCIDIELYQSMETIISNNYVYAVNKYQSYFCIVCDEAHYFMMDSNYNTNTILSYNFIKNELWNKLQIYISATMENIKKFIKREIIESVHYTSYWMNQGIFLQKPREMLNRNIWEYEADRNYDYVETHIITEKKDIKPLIFESKEKWLIFVDSREVGKAVKKDILAGRENEDEKMNNMVAFITSDYQNEEETTKEMSIVISKQKQSAKVLIATSVLDNGVSIKDIELRNIIIMADTQTEFVQMLGRKRYDGNRIKLYIFGYDRKHFVQRKNLNGRRLEIIRNYNKKFEKLFGYNKLPNIGDIAHFNNLEWNCMQRLHCQLLRDLMERKKTFENIQALFIAFNGCLVPNRLAFQNIENLNMFYNSILEKFDEYGEDAFLREQLLWLGKTEEDSQKIIDDAKKSLYEKCREKVLDALEKICNDSIEKNAWVHFKNNLRDDLLVLLKHVQEKNKDCKDVETHVNTTKKNNVCISKQYMKFLHDYCDIPFRLTCVASVYTVHRIEE